MKTGLKIDIQLWGKQKEGVKKEKCGVSVPEGHVARIVLSGRPASYGTTRSGRSCNGQGGHGQRKRGCGNSL
jgi:hypothetical protein